MPQPQLHDVVDDSAGLLFEGLVYFLAWRRGILSPISTV
jgi:hypothetical protein